tara:strand:- start:258 stop:443 length:186 start_codon:yes stop_codon:yes gene_type:complete
MKVYHLTIAFNEETEEIEYIEEAMDDEIIMDDDLLTKLVKGGFKDSVSIAVIEQLDDIAEA